MEPMNYSPIYESSPNLSMGNQQHSFYYSPSTPVYHHQAQHHQSSQPTNLWGQTPTYLPSFLAGDIHPSGSPGKGQILHTGSPMKRSPIDSEMFTPNAFSNNFFEEETKTQSKGPGRGPPKIWYDSHYSAEENQFLSPKTSPPRRNIANTTTSFSFQSPSSKSPKIKTNDSNSPKSTKTWVTVFGFPGGATSFILSNFSAIGTIIDTKSVPGSNWIHICYSSPFEAKKALAKNGTILAGSIMVGVIQKEDESTENLQESNRPTPEVIHTKKVFASNSSNVSTSQDVIKARIRPLTQGHEMEVNQNFELPKENNGIFTRFFEYFFGW